MLLVFTSFCVESEVDVKNSYNVQNDLGSRAKPECTNVFSIMAASCFSIRELERMVRKVWIRIFVWGQQHGGGDVIGERAGKLSCRVHTREQKINRREYAAATCKDNLSTDLWLLRL